MNKNSYIISAPLNMCIRNLIHSSFKIKYENTYLFTDLNISKKILKKFGFKFKKIFRYSLFSKLSRIIYFLLSSVETQKVLKNKKWKTMYLIKNEISNNNKLDKIISNDFLFIFSSIVKVLSINIFYYLTKIICLILLSFLSFGYIVKLLVIKPKKILFLHAHSNNDKILLLAAKILKIQTESLIHSWDNPTTKHILALKSDYYYAWNKEIKNEMSYLNNLSPSKIKIIGIPQFDSYFKKPCLKVNKKKKILITIFLPSTGLVSEINQKYFLEKFLQTLNWKKFNVIIRFHPGIFFDWLNKYKKKYPDLKINIPENITKADGTNDKILEKELITNSLKDLLLKTDIVINYFSTTSIDASFFEIPILNICINKKGENSLKWFYKWTHYKKLLNYNAIDVIYNFKDLSKKINYLSNKKNLKNKNAKFIKKNLILNTDGLSGYRLSNNFFKK